MITLFDFISVAFFLGLVVFYFRFCEQSARTLAHLMIAAVAFAVANQIGNAGYTLFAALLLVAGTGYAWLVARS